jgi:cation/acetate symporter
MFWRGLTTRGAVTGGVIGLVVAVTLIVLGPTVWVDVLQNKEALFAYKNPALFSMTIAFFATWLFSVTDHSEAADKERAAFLPQFIRSMTGVGAEGASRH